jgi:hypothetical protein
MTHCSHSSSLSATSRLVAVVIIQLLLILFVVVAPPSSSTVSAFVLPQKTVSTIRSLKLSSSSGHGSSRYYNSWLSSALASSSEDNNNVRGVIDLTDDDDDEDIGPDFVNTQQRSSAASVTTAPFLSQGELSSDPKLLNPDFSDDKQNRVILYIILTLVPILFLVPLMIGSRDLIPLDILPSVELT